jgi:RNA polymerase sigma-70 factor (ECF subfamily)
MKRFKKEDKAMTDEKFLWAYEKFRKTVYSVIFSCVRNTDDASELSQDTFMRLYTYDGVFDSDEHIKAWLIRVAINICNNHFRSKKYLSASPIPEDLPSDEQHELDEVIAEVMKLPEKYRIPIHLFYYEEYSVSEIAKILELPEATVKTRLKRGRDKLKKTLRKDDWL